MGGLAFRVCTVANQLVIAKTFFNWEGKLEKGGLATTILTLSLEARSR
jgi:hypothetical protein